VIEFHDEPEQLVRVSGQQHAQVLRIQLVQRIQRAMVRDHARSLLAGMGVAWSGRMEPEKRSMEQ
jgi:hypothetical protein